MAATSPCSSILPSAIADQYELLRGAAFGQALPLKARSGLALFLRRGMWGWAQTLAAATNSPQEQRQPSPIPWPTHGVHAAVVHVLATIAMSIHDRRSP